MNYTAQWKLKRMIKGLTEARGQGTSMISLIVPPNDKIHKINAMLAQESSTASNIKSRVNRQSVLDALSSTMQRLKLYTNVPPNGLVIYCGTIVTTEGAEKLVNIDFEPPRPVNTSLYLCDSRFHTEALESMFQDDQVFGFIIVGGDSCLYATLCGNVSTILQHFTVDLPNKHGRGGQSQRRFDRLREEKYHNYIRKVSELATEHFITNDLPNVQGLILAGAADFKSRIAKGELFDPRLQSKVLKLVDISYDGPSGLNQAIELSSDVLSNVKLTQERKLISSFFDEIATDTGKISYGVENTMTALDMGAVKTLMIWEDLPLHRYLMKDGSIVYKSVPNDILDYTEDMLLVEWIVDNYERAGAELALLTDRSPEGSQFCRGFGGIGALLRYRVELQTYDSDEDLV